MGRIGSTSYVLPIRLSYRTLNTVIRVSGQDLKPEINQFTVVDPHFWYSPLRTLPEFENARCDMREYPKWKFMNKNNPNIRGIFFSRIKNIFVNPDLGREGLHSMKKATLNSPYE